MRLDTSVDQIKGVGKVLAEKFDVLGVKTVGDLIRYFPRRYEDYSQVVPMNNIAPGRVTVKGRIESITGRYIRPRLHITEAVVADDTSKIRVVWFNQSYRAKQFASGQTYYFSGNYEFQRNRYVLGNPSAEKADTFGVSTAKIIPIYPEISGLKSQQIRKVVKEVLPLITMLPETLPGHLLLDQKLLSINDALTNLHFPSNSEVLEKAKERIAFEELLWLLLASALNKQDNMGQPGYKIDFKRSLAQKFVADLPFELTAGQKSAAWEIFKDMSEPSPMNRLLQGDVGSGKTVVAAFAAFMACKNGYQVAFMAPTEVLAGQHAKVLSKLLTPFGISTGLLLGSTKPAAKNVLKQHLHDGDLDVAVGTHALITPTTKFKKLGLVVVDEQHRFGVDQRRALLSTGNKPPHMLSMTATPIPRSLQLTVYGELEISILKELPSGRQPIITKLASFYDRNAIYKSIDDQIVAGRQVYVVCPLVDQSDHLTELKSVQQEHERLNKTVFKHRRVGLLHGQLKPDQKDEVMQQFMDGKIDILICTTVVEVGVDVPNATIMLIEGAERFGLAQLHQLRGRVGRSSHQSYCYLMPSSADVYSRRLIELENSNDGFYLAEVDLKMRGPGEVYGKMQHGKLDLNFVNLGDTQFIKRVNQAAVKLAQNAKDLLQYPQLNENVERYRRLTSLN